MVQQKRGVYSIKTDSIDNILVAGYLREYEQNSTIEVPHLVTSVISVYCKQYIIRTLGSNESTDSYKPDASEASNILKNNCTEYNTFVSNSTSIYANGSLYNLFRLDSDHNKHAHIKNIMSENVDQLIDIQSSETHTLFLTKKGNVYGIGKNDSGQLGLGVNIPEVNIPTLIPFKQKIKAIATGKLHSLFLNKDGKMLVCGYNYCGQLGIAANQMPPISVSDTQSDVDQSDDSDTDSDSDSD
eukprot:346347_1